MLFILIKNQFELVVFSHKTFIYINISRLHTNFLIMDT